MQSLVVGAAVRDIHRGCRKSLHDYLTIEPVIDAAEEERVTIPADFDPAAIRLVGNVNGSPPFQGSAQASRLAGPVGPPAAPAGRARRFVGALAGRGRDPLTAARPSRPWLITRQDARATVEKSSIEPAIRRTQTHSMSRYVVGIDLGTTNSALAYADGNAMDDDQPGPIASLPIPQVVAVNDVVGAAAPPVVPVLAVGQGIPGGCV